MNQPEASAQKIVWAVIFTPVNWLSFIFSFGCCCCFALPIRNVAFILFFAHRLRTDFAHDSTRLDPTRFDMPQFTNNLNVLRLHKLKKKVQLRAFVYVVYIRAQFLAYLLLLRLILFFRICLVFHMGVVTFLMRIECYSFVKIQIQIKWLIELLWKFNWIPFESVGLVSVIKAIQTSELVNIIRLRDVCNDSAWWAFWIDDEHLRNGSTFFLTEKYKLTLS